MLVIDRVELDLLDHVADIGDFDDRHSLGLEHGPQTGHEAAQLGHAGQGMMHVDDVGRLAAGFEPQGQVARKTPDQRRHFAQLALGILGQRAGEPRCPAPARRPSDNARSRWPSPLATWITRSRQLSSRAGSIVSAASSSASSMAARSTSVARPSSQQASSAAVSVICTRAQLGQTTRSSG